MAERRKKSNLKTTPKIDLPDGSFDWMNEQVLDALAEIEGPHVAKKRTTVIKLAFAHATQQPIKSVFDDPDTVNSSNWYSKWQYIPEVRQALEICIERASTWVDEHTAAMEYYYSSLRRQEIARRAAEAPGALATVMNDPEVRGSDRISAANSLLTWADPKSASQAQPAPPAPGFEQSVKFFGLNNVAEDELDDVIENLQAAIGRRASAASSAPEPETE